MSPYMCAICKDHIRKQANSFSSVIPFAHTQEHLKSSLQLYFKRASRLNAISHC